MDSGVLRDKMVAKALEFGADDAGVCLASDLLKGPTHQNYGVPEGIGGHHRILVLALSHPPERPEMDHFIKKEGYRFGNSEGNRRLMEISEGVGNWLEREGILSRDLHYYVEKGGVFLKGAAVLAGLGTIGVNNLFIHPGFGPRIRLRGRLVEAPVRPSAVLKFDPCAGCTRPCLDACPVGALPGGVYDTDLCQRRLDRDHEEGLLLPAAGDQPAAREIHCCRECEMACSFRGTREL